MMKNIALVYGGKSSEHDVSVKSFETIYNICKDDESLNKLLKKIVYIHKNGEFSLFDVDFSKDINSYKDTEKNSDIYEVFKILKKEQLYLFSTIHGQDGEDGNLQGAVKFFGISSNLGTVLSTSLSMSKFHLNRYLENNFDINIPKTVLLSDVKDFNETVFLDRYIIVKPNSLGSSLLTQRLLCNKENIQQIKQLCQEILDFDEFVLIQEFIQGQEYSCGCFENDKELISLPLMKIVPNDHFFSHSSKYQKNQANNFIVKVEDESDIEKEIKKISKDIFKEIGYEVMARFDYIISEEKIYFLEVNTLPGLKYSSIYPQMLNAAGFSLKDLIISSLKKDQLKIEKNTQFDYSVE